MRTLPHSTKPAGFTLAEVLIALGIVATVMVGMLAMIPHAIGSIRESNSLTIKGRIAQEVISNIQMSDWGQIDEDYKGKPPSKYDNEGIEFVFTYEIQRPDARKICFSSILPGK